jgi:hypothetical protein
LNAGNSGVPSAAIVELRQYALHPGKRDVLIELFDREFIEPQEALGATIIGQFRDLDHGDRFVWLRGFPDMLTRGEALAAFYGGSVWKAHRDVANSTMIDSDNVLLLEPVCGTPMIVPPRERAATVNGRLITATIHYPKPESVAAFGALFADRLRPVLIACGARILGEYVTSAKQNNFPRLPVREGECAYVWFGRFASTASYDAYRNSLADDPRWSGGLSQEFESMLRHESETLQLAPTSRSRL